MNMMIILGAGKLTECVIDLMLSESAYSVFDIYDDTKKLIQVGNKDFNIKGTIEDGIEFIKKNSIDFLILLGVNSVSRTVEISKELELFNKKPINYISKNAIISKNAYFHSNCIVFPGSYIGYNVKLSNSVVIYSNVSLEHDIIIKEGVFICPRVAIASNVKIEQLVFVGIGAVISNNITIQENSIIGAGTIVVKSILSNLLVYGNPLKIKKITNKIYL